MATTFRHVRRVLTATVVATGIEQRRPAPQPRRPVRDRALGARLARAATGPAACEPSEGRFGGLLQDGLGLLPGRLLGLGLGGISSPGPRMRCSIGPTGTPLRPCCLSQRMTWTEA